jgi:hypothetical protein
MAPKWRFLQEDCVGCWWLFRVALVLADFEFGSGDAIFIVWRENLRKKIESKLEIIRVLSEQN